MKILVLTKRQTTHNDIIDKRFGRSWEIPYGLSELGHSVRVICLSYQNKDEGVLLIEENISGNDIEWHSFNIGKTKICGILKYYRKVFHLAKKIKPDVIISMSDSVYTILGNIISKKIQCKHITDLQDNYEAYDSARIPGIIPLFRKAIRDCDGLVCVSDLLLNKIKNEYDLTKTRTITLINGVSKKRFFPKDKVSCRKKLNLPEHCRLLGIAGALYKDHGINTVFDGFGNLSKDCPDIHLAVAGPRDINIPKLPKIHDIGFLSHNNIPIFFNALDLAIICNKNSLQYSYGFPIKTFEILACETPLIATKMGPLEHFLKEYTQNLYEQVKINSFISTVKEQLSNPTKIKIPIITWNDLVKELETLLKSFQTK